MAPNCMMMVNALTKSEFSTPNRFSAISICPVDETGKNSVKPSTMDIIMVCRRVISALAYV